MCCRHPLLLGRHLQEQEKRSRAKQQGPASSQLRRLSNRKQNTVPQPASSSTQGQYAAQPSSVVLPVNCSATCLTANNLTLHCWQPAHMHGTYTICVVIKPVILDVTDNGIVTKMSNCKQNMFTNSKQPTDKASMPSVCLAKQSSFHVHMVRSPPWHCTNVIVAMDGILLLSMVSVCSLQAKQSVDKSKHELVDDCRCIMHFV